MGASIRRTPNGTARQGNRTDPGKPCGVTRAVPQEHQSSDPGAGSGNRQPPGHNHHPVEVEPVGQLQITIRQQHTLASAPFDPASRRDADDGEESKAAAGRIERFAEVGRGQRITPASRGIEHRPWTAHQSAELLVRRSAQPREIPAAVSREQRIGHSRVNHEARAACETGSSCAAAGENRGSRTVSHGSERQKRKEDRHYPIPAGHDPRHPHSCRPPVQADREPRSPRGREILVARSASIAPPRPAPGGDHRRR